MTGFFTLLALANSAINSFSVVALMATQGISFAAANVALTAYLAASAVGVLLGGWLADRTSRHGNVAALGFGLAAAIMIAGRHPHPVGRRRWCWPWGLPASSSA